jgi:SpoVK/Ycf46/Vps4 family AAA+-type ATPase
MPRRRLYRPPSHSGPPPDSLHLASEAQRAELRLEARGYLHNLLLGPSSGMLPDVFSHFPLLTETVTGKQVAGLPRGFARSLEKFTREERPQAPVARCGLLSQSVALIGDLLGLAPLDREVLRLLVVTSATPELDHVFQFCNDTQDRAWVHTAAACNLPPSEVRRALGPEGRLVQSGLASFDGDGPFGSQLVLLRGLAELALTPGLDEARLRSAFLPEAPPPTLLLEDFAGLGPQLDLASRLLQRAMQTKARGIHLLLYGPTGTGKTEASRLIAQRAGLKLYAAGLDPSRLHESQEEGPPSSRQRLSSLLLGQRLFAPGSAAILFDEFEDLFSPRSEAARGPAHFSKLWFNRLLETSPLPLVWATNSTEGIDPAFLRRFTFAIEFSQPGALQRARVLRRHLGEDGPCDADVQAIAQRFNAAPGQLGSAVAAARLLGPDRPLDRETLERLLAPIEKLVLGREPAPAHNAPEGSYDPSVVRASEDLTALAERAAALGAKADANLSLLFHGAPGTGKSEFARHLALRMGRALVVKRVSDLESPLVGVAEQQLAQAFREAHAERALLLFDEVDSFLCDRQNAVRTWETTRVNEFLQQLESFRGVVVCTTNLLSRLDPAALRRFALKVEFRPLDLAGAERLFASRLGPLLAEPLAAGPRLTLLLSGLPALTAGDFGAVERRLRALGERPTLDGAVALLAGEAGQRKGPARRAGFSSRVERSTSDRPTTDDQEARNGGRQ